MKKRLLSLTGLFLAIFSFSTLAVTTPSTAIPQVGTVFSNTYRFFRDLVTGNANIHDAYFISFILYFVVFLAIFMEGLSRIPVFGEKGKVSKPGKAFAIAAAGLASIALFIVDQSSGISTTERLSSLIAPWGVWGGLLIAGIIALITFRFVKDSDTFKEKTVLVMAIAAAVGITFAGFLLTMENLVGWGFLIMLLAFVAGGINHYVEGEPTRKTAREDKENKEMERIKKAKDDKRIDDEKEDKKKEVSPIKDTLKDALDSCAEVRAYLTRGNRKLAYDEIQELNSHLDKTWKQLGVLRRKYGGDDAEKITKIIDEVQAAQEEFLKEVKGKIPKRIIPASKTAWDVAVAAALPIIKKITGSLGNAFKNVE